MRIGRSTAFFLDIRSPRVAHAGASAAHVRRAVAKIQQRLPSGVTLRIVGMPAFAWPIP